MSKYTNLELLYLEVNYIKKKEGGVGSTMFFLLFLIFHLM